jgi:hypothetical protein
MEIFIWAILKIIFETKYNYSVILPENIFQKKVGMLIQVKTLKVLIKLILETQNLRNKLKIKKEL